MASTLIRGFRELNFLKPKERRIMIFGNDASGKTTLLYRLKLNELVTSIPTIGFNVETIQHKKINYTFWDVGGCDKIRPLWRHYVAEETNLIYVHDPTDGRIDESLEGVRLAAEMMLEVQAQHIWVVFNKQDALPVNAKDEIIANHREIFSKELQIYSDRIGWTIVDLPGFSAMTGKRCSELLGILHGTLQSATGNGLSARNSTKPRSDISSVPEQPDEATLIGRIELEHTEEVDADAFWNAFLTADLEVWGHRSHLRAGYMLLLSTLRSGGSIFDCAEDFLEHLQRLKERQPTRFRNTEHRTMTIFWLHQLRLAVLNYKTDKCLEKWPTADLFHEVLLHSPYLMYGALWKNYYTKDLIMSPEAKQYWRLPDLQALPDFAEKTYTQKRHVRQISQEEPHRLMRFAFAVVQKYLSSNVRRGWLVKQALAALETTTMRLRAENPSMPPYSETKAYFWIQVVHAALATVSTGTNQMPIAKVPLDRLSFASFRALFDMDPSLWRDYYSPILWDSLQARAAFVAPDLKPLPNIITVPSVHNVMLAMDKQIDSARIGLAAEIPSMEELSMQSSILLQEVSELPEPERRSSNISRHAHLLYYLFKELVDHGEEDAAKSATRATSAMMRLSGDVGGLTLKAFWTQQVLGASSKVETTITFDDFIRTNLHLVYTDLPLCYYSQELLQSFEAKETIVEPDRRKLKGFIPVIGSPTEDDWVML